MDPADPLSTRTGPGPVSYGPRALRGTVIAATFRIAATAVSLATTMVLARLLTPEDFGVIDMVATLTALLAISEDLGLSLATIQREEVTREQVSNLFWLNAGFGLLLWSLCGLSAPLLVGFYEEPALFWVAPAVGMNFFWSGLAAQPGALLQRRFEFGRSGSAEVAGRVLGLVAGVAGALGGLSYWALVLNTLVGAAVRTILLFWLSGLRPRLPRRGTGVRPMVAMGGWYVGFGFMNYIARNADNILIGRFIGAAALGLYARAYQLYLLPYRIFNSVLGQVAIPTLSRLQEDLERFQRAYVGLVQVMLLGASASAGWLAVMAPEVILVVLGEEWLDVVPLFRIFSAVGILRPLLGTAGWIFVATGRTRRMFAWSIVPATVLSAAFVIGLRFGLEGVAWAYAAGWIGILLVPGMVLAVGTVGLTLRSFTVRVARHLGVVIISVGAAILLKLGLMEITRHPLALLMLFFPTILTVHYVLIRLVTPGTLQEIRRLATAPREEEHTDEHPA